MSVDSPTLISLARKPSVISKAEVVCSRIFDFRGRAARGEYLLTLLAIFAVHLILAIPYLWLVWQYASAVIDFGVDSAAMMLDDMFLAEEVLAVLVFWNLLCASCLTVCLFVFVFTLLRRLNDAGLSKWWICTLSLPFIGLVLTIVMVFWPTKSVEKPSETF